MIDIATRLFFLAAAFGFAVVAALLVAIAWITLTNRLEERRWAIRDRDDALRERSLLDQLAPAPDGTVPPESPATGRAHLAAAATTPEVEALRDLVGDIDWPETEDPR